VKRRHAIWLQPMPADIAPTDEVVYYGQATTGAIFVFAIAFPLIALGVIAYQGFVLWSHFLPWLQTLLTLLSLGQQHYEGLYWNGQPLAMKASFAGSLLAAVLLSAWVFFRTAIPHVGIRHLSGPRRLDGREAELAAVAVAARGVDADNPPYLKLHPLLKRKKRDWNKHLAIVGGVGSGKTVILWEIVRRIAKNSRARALIYDPKGDYTQALLHYPHARLLCPWDARSARWQVAADVRSLPEIQALAAAIIPPDLKASSASFWKNAAADVLAGIIQSCIEETKGKWHFGHVAERLTLAQPELYALLSTYAPEVASHLRDEKSSTASSLLSTLAEQTKIIHDFARGWTSPMQEEVSLREWCEGTGAGRLLIVQAGPDSRTSGAMMAALVNTVAGIVNSPAFPDDESREVFLVLDELQSIGRTSFPELVERARSKGFSIVCALQDLLALGNTYGDSFVKSFPGMIGTIVVCQMQLGESRRMIAEWFGKARVAVSTRSVGGSERATTLTRGVQEEERAVVQPHELTDELGVQEIKGKKFIRAIVSPGGDLLTLDFPIRGMPKKSTSRVPAFWTTPEAAAERFGESQAPEEAEALKPEESVLEPIESAEIATVCVDTSPPATTLREDPLALAAREIQARREGS
jgi:hypothetical protein